MRAGPGKPNARASKTPMQSVADPRIKSATKDTKKQSLVIWKLLLPFPLSSSARLEFEMLWSRLQSDLFFSCPYK